MRPGRLLRHGRLSSHRRRELGALDLRPEPAHLRWVTNLQERLPQQTSATDDLVAEDGAAIPAGIRHRSPLVHSDDRVANV